jgi:hypothetical protein
LVGGFDKDGKVNGEARVWGTVVLDQTIAEAR